MCKMDMGNPKGQFPFCGLFSSSHQALDPDCGRNYSQLESAVRAEHPVSGGKELFFSPMLEGRCALF